MIKYFENFDNKIKRLKNNRLINLKDGIPVKWIDTITSEEKTGVFKNYGDTCYKVLISDSLCVDYISYNNITFKLNNFEINVDKYNL